MIRILFILTNATRIGPNQRPTGYEFSEVAHPYDQFIRQGYTVDFASPKGGTPPADGYDAKDPVSRVFREGPGFIQLNQSQRLADVATDAYDAIFFPGGLGPMVDLVDEPLVKQVIAGMYERGRVVGAVCHGPVALLNVSLSTGRGLLDGKRVTSFTEAEEEGHSEQDVPFMLDAALRQQGAEHTSGAPFAEHIVVDGHLVTGQNPASAGGVARAMIQLLEPVSVIG